MQSSAGRNNRSDNKPVRNKKGIFIFILIIIGLVTFSRHEPVNTVNCTPELIASKPDIIMLGAWWCRYCYKAKKYFQQNNISYCQYDIENTDKGKSLYKKHGGGEIPILLIGTYKLKGFSSEQVEHTLSLLSNSPDLN